MNKKIESVQMMRGIAALSVVFFHFEIFSKGGFGVDLFFCISGFIMMLVTEKNTDDFLKKRALRIIPLYYLLTLGVFTMNFIAPQLFVRTETDFASLLRSLFFISGIKAEPIVGVGWTLCYEMLFYLLFFVAFKISHKNRHWITFAFLAIIVLTGLVFRPTNDYLMFYTRPILLEFALGMFAYKIISQSTIQYNTIQYNTIQYNTIQYNTIQYNTIQYNTIPVPYTCYFNLHIPVCVGFERR
jgi:peptidoglycan/LPS O-acetylase OafA/YrhL